ncbi:type II toxin-antitoxin system RelB family antitoxin [Pseudomonas syringae]|uniref:type II toxin-antitoxin system RelB family antitoxin n=1 Tax=Pseudomonas syringae TaxID=317 RepID=UPI000CDA3D6B|nr:antitoxin [Pseudomonas syringae]POR65458.1 antitoxin [Pseudomonas syringae pv. syringae]POR73714.1 antitoxin [Pseudomonas syringae pv. syringae]
MNARISAIVSQFETEEQADSYDKWFRAQVQTSINDPAPNLPHDQIMAEMRAVLELKQTPSDAG